MDLSAPSLAYLPTTDEYLHLWCMTDWNNRFCGVQLFLHVSGHFAALAFSNDILPDRATAAVWSRRRSSHCAGDEHNGQPTEEVSVAGGSKVLFQS